MSIVTKSTTAAELLDGLFFKGELEFPWLISTNLPSPTEPHLSQFLTDPAVYVCDSLSAATPELLKLHDIGYVLSLDKVRDEQKLPKNFFRDHGIERRYKYIDDSGCSQDSAILDAFKNFRELYLKAQNEGKGMIVHCILGASRSPSIACAFYALHKKITFREAVEAFSEKRNVIIDQDLAANICRLHHVKFE